MAAAREGRGPGRWWEGGRRGASHPRDRPDGTRGGKPAGRTPLPHTGRLAVPGGRGAREHALLTGKDDVTSCPRGGGGEINLFPEEMEFLNGIFSRGFLGINSGLLRLEFCLVFFPHYSFDFSFLVSRFFIRIFKTREEYCVL